MKILFFDDDKTTVDMLMHTIDWAGFGFDELIPAYTVHQAKTAIEEGSPPDVMICDIEAPGETGIDLLRWVRERGYLTENIFLTNYESFAFASEAMKLECMEYILKMSPVSEIEEAVQRSLKRRELRERLMKVQDQERGGSERDRDPGRGSGSREGGGLPSMTQEIKAYIDDHFTERISRTELASRFYISRDHLSHIFSANFGMTIPEYINKLRVEKAREELAGGATVAEAAEKAGFDNLSYFSTLFRKTVGLSPTDYQKSSRKVKDPHKK
ncbi:MAG: DNA-binding response regulator [Firmicutes bacterium]|nr:DNA-binding response regulator [Bacillota bacterium]